MTSSQPKGPDGDRGAKLEAGSRDRTGFMSASDASSARPSATDQAYVLLKQDILDAKLQPHQQLLESELAERLGMSRTPVREACIRLQAAGLLEIVPRHGIRIVGVSAKDMAEVYDLLGTLESRAAELATESATEEDLAALDDAVERMQRALDADDLDTWADADADFHRRLVVASGNRHLAKTAMEYADLVNRARMVTLRLRERPVQSVADHRELVSVIRSGNSSLAFQKHLDHRRAAAANLTQLLESLSVSTL